MTWLAHVQTLLQDHTATMKKLLGHGCQLPLATQPPVLKQTRRCNTFWGCVPVRTCKTALFCRHSKHASLQVPDAPPELKEWSQNTSLGVFAGLMFGGGRQWLRDRQAGIHQILLLQMQRKFCSSCKAALFRALAFSSQLQLEQSSISSASS